MYSTGRIPKNAHYEQRKEIQWKLFIKDEAHNENLA